MVQVGGAVRRSRIVVFAASAANLLVAAAPARAQSAAAELPRVAELVARLAAPLREQRLAAQEALLTLSADDARQLEDVEAPPGFEARTALEYVRTHRPTPAVSVTIAAGAYKVGSDVGRDRNPERTITLAAFTIDDCEVTCFDYWRFVRATGTAAPPGWVDGRYPYGGERVPVGNVSPAEAKRFAEWVGGRLPTSDEWEVAATGGTGKAFPWNESFFPQLANFMGGELVEVRSEPQDRSPFGGYDFCASLREWVVLPDGMVAARGGSFSSGQFLYLRLTRGPDESVRDRRPTIGLRVCDRKR
jgi:formylglycine-generating enzyme required for sulfatase activity